VPTPLHGGPDLGQCLLNRRQCELGQKPLLESWIRNPSPDTPTRDAYDTASCSLRLLMDSAARHALGALAWPPWLPAAAGPVERRHHGTGDGPLHGAVSDRLGGLPRSVALRLVHDVRERLSPPEVLELPEEEPHRLVHPPWNVVRAVR
jgi:hypothetical protein